MKSRKKMDKKIFPDFISDRKKALKFLELYGTEPISWQTLESSFQYWFSELGYVGYQDTGNAWVVAGPPVGPPEIIPDLAKAFVAIAEKHRRRVVFFGAERFLASALSGKTLCIGVRPQWNPQSWRLDGPSRSSLRYQLKRARRNGIRIRRLMPEEIDGPHSAFGPKIRGLVEDWQERHALAGMGFIVALELYVFPEHHIYLIAERGEELVGLLSAVPVFQRNGWFVEDLLRRRSAPGGTNELLVSTFFDLARSFGSTYLTLGLVPLAGPISFSLRVAKTTFQPLFNFEGLEHFKKKLQPTKIEPRYLVIPRGTGQFRALVDVLTAFSKNSLVHFALLSLARGPLVALKALTILLALWLGLLVATNFAPWFPSQEVHRAWCFFDGWLTLGLISLCRRYRNGLAFVLATAVSLDAIITVSQAIFFNGPRVKSFSEGLIVIVACIGPSLGAVVLWGSWRRSNGRCLA
jgi:phosphatidylglycerol lysyltransferase